VYFARHGHLVLASSVAKHVNWPRTNCGPRNPVDRVLIDLPFMEFLPVLFSEHRRGAYKSWVCAISSRPNTITRRSILP
jgi:hypothetical protein